MSAARPCTPRMSPGAGPNEGLALIKRPDVMLGCCCCHLRACAPVHACRHHRGPGDRGDARLGTAVPSRAAAIRRIPACCAAAQLTAPQGRHHGPHRTTWRCRGRVLDAVRPQVAGGPDTLDSHVGGRGELIRWCTTRGAAVRRVESRQLHGAPPIRPASCPSPTPSGLDRRAAGRPAARDPQPHCRVPVTGRRGQFRAMISHTGGLPSRITGACPRASVASLRLSACRRTRVGLARDEEAWDRPGQPDRLWRGVAGRVRGSSFAPRDPHRRRAAVARVESFAAARPEVFLRDHRGGPALVAVELGCGDRPVWTLAGIPFMTWTGSRNASRC